MRKMILFLEKSDLSAVSWVLVNDQGAPEQTGLHQSLSAAAEVTAAHNVPVIVIAAPEDVLLITTQLPKLNRQRLLQALPFAIEEQLLADVDELHFALGDYSPAGFLPVAIINKVRLTTWLTELKAAGIQPTAIIPAPLALPYQECEWHVKIFGDSAILRTGELSGFACDKQNLNVLLQLKLAELADKPTAVTITNYSTDSFPQATNHAPEKDFILALTTLSDKPGINLLQGSFQPKLTATQSKKIWILAAYVALAWLAVILCSNIVSLIALSHQEAKLETAINTIYKHNFPAATSVVAPKARMTEKLNNLTNENHKNRLLTWLAYLAQSKNQVKTVKLKQLDFRNNQLSVEFTAPTLGSVDTLTTALTQQGLKVRQQNVVAAGTGATGTLIISDGDS